VGYLPEERGLYRNRKVLETLVYLAELKGVDREAARRRATALLERMGLEDRAESKVRDLSRGMQQRLQVIASVVHDPELVFLDEPFQGLDPVNVERVKEFITDLQREGEDGRPQHPPDEPGGGALRPYSADPPGAFR
jgi:ABC-2 type transport system ATP-binding protein